MDIRWSREISRRYLLSNAAGAATGVAAILGMTMTAQAAKLSQKAASYQKSPKGKLRCDNCTLFQAPTACKSVEGPVAAPGWCSVYVAMRG